MREDGSADLSIVERALVELASVPGEKYSNEVKEIIKRKFELV